MLIIEQAVKLIAQMLCECRVMVEPPECGPPDGDYRCAGRSHAFQLTNGLFIVGGRTGVGAVAFKKRNGVPATNMLAFAPLIVINQKVRLARRDEGGQVLLGLQHAAGPKRIEIPLWPLRRICWQATRLDVTRQHLATVFESTDVVAQPGFVELPSVVVIRAVLPILGLRLG